MNQKICTDPSHAVSRRNFLKLSGAAMVTISLPAYLRRAAIPTTFVAQQANYPRQVIGKLTGLKAGEPLTFRYPWDHAAATNFLIMLNEPAGGGIGPGKNIVAFNYLCPHQGGPLNNVIHGDVSIAGPCPLHWSTFDLTRHGMVISGHATQGLPQIMLETDGDDIVATGVLGLLYGYYDNRVDPNA